VVSNVGRNNMPSYIELGVGSYFAHRPRVAWEGWGSKVKIGRYTSISVGVLFFLGGHHYHRHVSQFPFSRAKSGRTKGDITIGSDCWLGQQSVIMDGVTIGDGATVGAFCLVAKDVPPYAIVVGNSARIIGYRFGPAEIEALLRIKWWDWGWKKIRRARGLLESENVAEFIRRFG